MSSESIQEDGTCRSKTGHVTRKTGKKSANLSENGPEIVVKAVPLILTAAPEIKNSTPLPGVGLSLPSPTLTTNPATVTPTTCGHGVSDATPPMTPSTMPIPAENPAVSVNTTDNRRSLVGKTKKPTHGDLMRVIRHDELQLHLHQMKLDNYKPAMDAMKRYLEIFGSQSPNFYMTKNKQVIAACQMNGLNDPNATRKQVLAATTCYEMLYETIMRCMEMGLDKEQVKQEMNDAINKAAEFFGLGNKKAVAARNKKRKSA
jgi:hypothetical protein